MPVIWHADGRRYRVAAFYIRVFIATTAYYIDSAVRPIRGFLMVGLTVVI